MFLIFFLFQVNLVVNYDLPRLYGTSKADCDTYLHRIGRTGRFGKTGNAINIVDGREDLRLLREIENHFSKFPGYCAYLSILKVKFKAEGHIVKLAQQYFGSYTLCKYHIICK